MGGGSSHSPPPSDSWYANTKPPQNDVHVGYNWPDGYNTKCTGDKGKTAEYYDDVPFGHINTKWGWYCEYRSGTYNGNCPWSYRDKYPSAYCTPYPSYKTFGAAATPEFQSTLTSTRAACDETNTTAEKYKPYIPTSLYTSAQNAVKAGKSYTTEYAEKSSNPAQLLVTPAGTTLQNILDTQSACQNMTQQIKSQAVDKCSNPETLIDASNECMYNSTEGMTTREGFNTTDQTLNEVFAETLAQNKAAYTASQNALNSIQKNFASPQLQNKSPNPNPTQVDPILRGYSEYTMGDDTKTLKTIRDDLKTQMAYTSTIYNDCTNTYSLLDMSGIEKCIPNQYNAASSACSYANDLAISANDTTGGMKKIPKLWGDAKNSLPGNTIINNNTILTNVKNQCTNWVQMYDKWQEDKQRAEDLPCIPERSIEPAFNPVIQKIVENWSNASEKYIESLLARLRVIEEYIQNYPDIVELKSTNVQALPPGQPPYFTMQRVLDPKTPGVSPTFSLRIDMPEGATGAKGQNGETGPPGPRGKKGPHGSHGKTGDWEIPIQYKNT